MTVGKTTSSAPRPAVSSPVETSSGFLGQLPVRQKLTLIGLSLGIPLVLSGFTLINRDLTVLRKAENAVRIANVLQPIQDLQRELRDIRVLNPSEVSTERVTELKDTTETLINLAQETGDPIVIEYANGLSTEVNGIISAVENPNLKNDEFFAFVSKTVNGTLANGFNVMADQGGLLNTSSLEGNKVSALAAKTLPRNFPSLGAYYGSVELTGEAALAQNNGVLTPEQRAVAAEQLRIARGQLAGLTAEVNILIEGFPESKQRLGALYETALAKTAQAFDFLDKNVVQPEKVTATNQELFDGANPMLEAQYAVFSETTVFMRELFEREAAQARQNVTVTIFLIALVLLLATALFFIIVRGISGPLNALANMAESLSRGNYGVRAPVTSNDELGTLADSFNAAAAQLQENERRSAQERLEQEQLQNNIGSFLDVTMDISEGDLTKRGVVTEDILGNVVDSINLMTEELAYVLGDVQSASKSVSIGSQQMLSTTSQIQEGTAMTAAEAQRVAQQVQELTASIRQMADQAQQSANAARQALLASQQGQEAVTGTLDGMQNIRREVQGVAKSIKGLGDRSLEIQEIVDTISGIARQTNLLALNATIEAAGAGEAGGRFSIVADEVRKLADNSATATGRIAQLIQNIQTEIQDVVVNVEESTREVEQGYRVAGTAGERLRQIGDLTQQSAQLAESISAATQQQVDGIEQMNNAVQQIAQIAQRSQESVDQGRAAADQLQRLADELNESLSRFRLPS